jgi:hypothetical protein
MVRSLTIILMVGVVLGIGAPAFCQTYYYGNAYQGQGRTDGAYGANYGRPGYQQYAQPQQYGQNNQYAQPQQYGQYNQFAQPQPGAGAYQNAPGSYYQNYGQYTRQGAYGYNPGSQAYAPGGQQSAPNNYYGRQQAQPNPYYGVPQVQQWETPRTTSSTTRVRRARSRSRRGAEATTASNTAVSKPAKESRKEKPEIYWDPNSDDDDASSQAVSQETSQRRPAVRASRNSAGNRTVRAQGSTGRARVRREARTTATPPPPKRQTMAWGKKEPKPPSSRRPMRWGKEAKPVSVTSEPGSTPSAQVQSRTTTSSEVQVESKAPAKKFQWGRTQ